MDSTVKKNSENYVIKNSKKLRSGYTTGTCAVAASKAALFMWFTDSVIKEVKVNTLIEGIEFELEVLDITRKEEYISCAVIKDAGDDPDVTHGIKIVSKVSLSKEKTIEDKSKIAKINIDGGIGVGRVTRNGLQRKIGEAAINNVPRKMIEDELLKICEEFNYKGQVDVVISIPNGEMISKKTMNERLGIVKGLSILGTTGVVVPMSEKALIDTIKLELDMFKQSESKILLLTPGNYGKQFASHSLGLDIEKCIKCSNFIGETLDYACYLEIEKILIVGHAGKLVKLAGGIMNTHSSVADCRFEILSAHGALAGADSSQVKQIMNCITIDEVIPKLKKWGLNEKVWNSIGKKINFHLNYRVKNKIHIEFVVFTIEQGVLIQSEKAKEFMDDQETIIKI